MTHRLPPAGQTIPADKRWCIIADMDGTLTDPSHRRHLVTRPDPDWKAFYDRQGNDTVCQPVVVAYHAMCELPAISAGIIVSARPSKYRKVTELWLTFNRIRADRLYMRGEKDKRKDEKVKRDLLVQVRRDGFEPYCVFDDRNRVVDMWRAEGLTCFQVAAGNF